MLRVVADHSRTCAFLIGDGVVPGNEGRGYVLRRLMRRVIRNMRLLGSQDSAIGELMDATIAVMAPQYPELNDEAKRIHSVSVNEEAAFLQTLRNGLALFESASASVRGSGGTKLAGEQAFVLHDTFGFPIDLTLEMASEAGLSVDEEGFRSLMSEQRERAKADAHARKAGFAATTAYREILDTGGGTTFVGYDISTTDAHVLGIVRDGESVPVASTGDHAEVILDRSPFYAEAGGQLGDHGRLTLDDGTVFVVYDVQAPVPGLFVHRGRVEHGEVTMGALATAAVDIERRKAISRAHTATHMIHRAFRERLGETATQMGSENAPGRLRFDFPNPEPVAPSVLGEVEDRVNSLLIDDLAVSAEVMSQDEARAMGAMALFGEKYGNEVRVVSVGVWAHELCGGTHAQRSGQLGVVTFLSEGSIGAGVRRVEALVGVDAYRFLAREHVLVQRLSEMVKAPADQLVERIEGTITALKDAERDIGRFKSAQLVASVEGITGAGEEIGDVRLWAFIAPKGTTPQELRELVTHARGRIQQDVAAVLVGAAIGDNSVAVVVACSARAVERGRGAPQVLSCVMTEVEGRGGGKPDMAQGGGRRTDGIEAGFEAVRAHLRAAVAG
jgi:alanyl-tRNA synthetase